MSLENRKREYDRLVSLGREPPANLVKEFGDPVENKKAFEKVKQEVAEVAAKKAKVKK